MPTALCVENIKKKSKLGPCTDAYCIKVSFGTGIHCTESNPPLNPDDPVGPQFDENLHGQGKGGYCYCCCSCFGSDTPIEVGPGEYAPARDIGSNEKAMAAGTDLRWEPRAVQSASTWDTSDGVIPSVYLVRYSWEEDGPEGFRDVFVSPDHLFLVEDGTLVAVHDLTKEALRLRRADGGLSTVIVVAQGSYRGGMTTIQMEGEFDGSDLTGHLLNTYGLVTADFKVQVYYASQHLDPRLLRNFDIAKENLSVGTPEYHAAFPDDAYARFLEDPALWPEGFAPTLQTQLHIPATAARYLTKEQSRDIWRNAPRGGVGNTYAARSLLYLFKLSRGLYPDVDFLLDWDEPLPNAYTWKDWGRRTVVFTGGLLRLTELKRDGLSVILASMLSYRFPEVRCVGAADHTATFRILHDIWDDDLFVSVVEGGLPQVEQLFSYVSRAHAGPDRKNVCEAPGLSCRLDCYKAGLSMGPVPECAIPKPSYFGLKDARAVSPTSVQITFDRSLDVPTAEVTGNYVFEPDVEVRTALVPSGQENQVVLEVGDLVPQTTYLVKASHLVSRDDVPLDPHHRTGTFTTK